MTGTRLPDDWQPSESDIIYGIGLGFVTSQVLDIAEDLRLWAGANANRQIARKLDWSLAFKSWMRREAKKRGSHGTTNRTMAAFDHIIDQSAGGSLEGGAGAKNITPTGSGVRQDADRAVAARQPAEPGSLFSFHRKDP